MSSNKQHREHERLRLQRELEARRAQEARRRQMSVIASVVGALVVIAAVIVIVVVNSGGSSKKPSAAGSPTSTSTDSAAATDTADPADTAQAAPTPTQPCATPTGDKATFDGLTVTGATDLTKQPTVTGTGTGSPTEVQCQDLVVGKGALATSGASVTVQYVGLVYSTGKVFQSSWSSSAATFTASAGEVIDGFADGIAGAGKITGMHVGGRRLIVMPADAAYGANPPSGSGIPANATLAFVVDLQGIGS